MVGETISHYRIIEIIGKGGMGIVYKAEDLRLGRPVALKFLPHHLDSEEHERRFIQEAKTASSLDHPNICTIYEIDKLTDGRMFIAMAYYKGETLKKKLESGVLPVDRALDVCLQISSGLAQAHDHGIIHRDIKPANIMITSDDSRAKILDFGLAKIAGMMGITRSGVAVGTIAYMSPEQARGLNVDHRTDIWSMGVLLYEVLSGRLPFPGDSEVATLRALMQDDPVPVTSHRSDIPAVIQRILKRSMAKSPEKRYSSIQEMRQDLLEASDTALPTRSIAVSVSPETPEVPVGTTEKRNVSAVVSKLSAYTEMIENLQPVEVVLWLKRLRELAVRTTEQHGGLLNQFFSDQISVLFGIPVSNEDDYVRSIRFVLQLHEEIRRIGPEIEARIGKPFRVQTGIHSGLIIAELVNQPDCRYRVTGSTVAVATRLAEEAGAW